MRPIAPTRRLERNAPAMGDDMAWDGLQDLRAAHVDVRERLNDSEKNWVLGLLVSRSGVNGALWRGENGLRLSVEYDADVINALELIDLLQACGLHAKAAPLARR
jgi:hypothetical protein